LSGGIVIEGTGLVGVNNTNSGTDKRHHSQRSSTNTRRNLGKNQKSKTTKKTKKKITEASIVMTMADPLAPMLENEGT
jgi:hypothetical protein